MESMMTPQPKPLPISPVLALHELDRIEPLIAAAEQHLALLRHRQAALIDGLEAATAPEQVRPPPPPWMPSGMPGFEFKGERSYRSAYIDIYLSLLRRLWIEFPERRVSMATSMASYGTSRRYVARTRGDLFQQKSERWVLDNSRSLVDGWYVDTNLNLERLRHLVPAAVRGSGLEWGVDVKVYWR
jgi:hypothetical protein